MDVWAWLDAELPKLREQGEARLADLLGRLGPLVCDHEHELFDALYPEALSLARENGNPWLEVFVRHWLLQSQVLHRRDANFLAEAVDLLDFAKRPDAAGCPQARCAVQDLASCYAAVDGPGLAVERERISREGLEGLSPEVTCFRCISAELSSALRDGGRASEALAVLDHAAADFVVLNPDAEDENLNTLTRERARTLLALGRADEALTEIDKAMPVTDAEEIRLGLRIVRCDALLCLGRADEAKQALEPLESLLKAPSEYVRWAECLVNLCERGLWDNDWRTDRQLSRLQGRLTRHRSLRDAIRIAFHRAQLAMRRGRPRTALAALEAARHLVPQLNKPLGAPERLQTLQGNAIEVLARRGKVQLPATPEALLAEEGVDPERQLERLRAGRRRWSERPDVVVAEARVLILLGRPEEAVSLLTSELDNEAAVDGRFVLLSSLLLHSEDTDNLRARATGLLAQATTAEQRSHCHWALALSYKAEDELELATWHRSEVEVWSVLQQAAEEVSCELTDWPFQAAPWSFCRIDWANEDGSSRDLHGLQLEAGTALVIELSDSAARYGDLVITGQTPLPAEERGGKRGLPIHVASGLQASGGFDVLALEGEAVEGEALERSLATLRSHLGKWGGRVQLALSPRLAAVSADAGVASGERREIHAFVAVPMREGVYSGLEKALLEVARDWPGALSCQALSLRLVPRPEDDE